MTTPSMMAGVQADLAALKARYPNVLGAPVPPKPEPEEYAAALAEGRVQHSANRRSGDREEYARRYAQIATCLPTRRTRERDEIACIRPRTLAPVRSLLVDPRAMTDAVFAAAGGGE